VALLTGTSKLVLARGLVGAGSEVLISSSASSATRDDKRIVHSGEVVDLLAGLLVVQHGADGHLQHSRFAAGATAVRSQTVASALALVLRVVAEVDQRIVACARLHHDIAAMASVAAGRTALGHEFFAPERHAAVTAVPGFYANFCFIDEHSAGFSVTGISFGRSSWPSRSTF
jgi:hypothetical protein